jgi:hypothetical protein
VLPRLQAVDLDRQIPAATQLPGPALTT